MRRREPPSSLGRLTRTATPARPPRAFASAAMRRHFVGRLDVEAAEPEGERAFDLGRGLAGAGEAEAVGLVAGGECDVEFAERGDFGSSSPCRSCAVSATDGLLLIEYEQLDARAEHPLHGRDAVSQRGRTERVQRRPELGGELPRGRPADAQLAAVPAEGLERLPAGGGVVVGSSGHAVMLRGRGGASNRRWPELPTTRPDLRPMRLCTVMR